MHQFYRRLIGVIVMGMLFAGAAQAQEIVQQPTETPAQINLEPAAQIVPQDVGGPTPTRTPTPEGIALLEAKDFANVRAEPSTDAAQLGTIRAGEKYNVIGRYVSWIQFQYQSSPTGKGWVYGELVNLTGNTNNIPDIDPYAQSQAAGAGAANATATQNIITQTPGGILTATLIAQQLGAGAVTPTDSGTREILPTFTYPPDIVAVAPTDGAAASTPTTSANQSPTTTNNGDLPPIVPILILGGIGLFGLGVSTLRRS
jgi:Bacterial SH3 domain